LASVCSALRRLASALSIDACADAMLAGDGVVVVGVDVVVVRVLALVLVRERDVVVLVPVRDVDVVVVGLGVVVVDVVVVRRLETVFGLVFGVVAVGVVVVVFDTNTGALARTGVDAELAVELLEAAAPLLVVLVGFSSAVS
jgi:hypothetical protein